jgi:glutamate/tyrosine decarboxylase-like PLP-dependent enzyme
MHAIGECDSVTVDPHKAGFVPYGAGCIVLKHGFLKDVVAETAPYVLDSSDTTSSNEALPQIGRFILEGSKPGAAAAATWFSHRMIPLNMDGYGRQLTELCRIARDFETSIREGESSVVSGIRLISVLKPHLNIVCLFALPTSATSYSEINELNAALAARFGVADVLSIQSYDYLLSHTVISKDFPYIQEQPRLMALEQDADAIDVLRLVFMNRWVEKTEASGQSYLQEFHSLLLSEASRIWKEMRSERDQKVEAAG